MAIIYKITNILNGKSYIGQTRMTLKLRMQHHYSQANIPSIGGIDGAIRKYGKENFLVEILEECDVDQLDERERYYVSQFDTYNNGYNLTIGGQDGFAFVKTFNKNEVIECLNQYKTIKETAKALGCCEKTLSQYMREENIPKVYQPTGRIENLIGKGRPFQEGEGVKPIYCQELKMEFNSLKECSQFLMDNGYSKAKTMDATRKSLSRHLNGQRRTYLNMHFSYL